MGKIYCFVDQAKYEAYNPELQCVHVKNVMDGDTYCELAVRPKKRKDKEFNKEWVDALELGNMLHLLKCSTISALQREESRGVHFREDFPYTDNDKWLRENIIHCQGGALAVETRPVTASSISAPQGRIPYLDMMKKMMESRSDVGGHH